MPRLVLEEEEPREPEWRVLANTGYIRQKYLHWSPEDVREETDLESLITFRNYYCPSSQPRNAFETAYFALMVDAVNARLKEL